MVVGKGAASMVISQSELGKIQQRLLPEAKRVDHAKVRSEQLHEVSKKRAGTWTNTIEGSRKKNIEDYARRVELEELERQKLDAEEAAIQLNSRKRIIGRANQLLYDEADRIKSFHSKMQMCDVLAEREAQVNLKEELTRLEQIREERFLEMDKHNYRKMLERELREKVEQEEARKKATAIQSKQLIDYKRKRVAEMEDDILEGELLRKKAAEDAEVERMKVVKKREDAARALAETQKANEYLKAIREEERKRYEREAAKIKEYAAKKDAQEAARKRRAQELFDGRQAVKQKIIDVQTARLAEMMSNDMARVERQVAEKAMKDEQARLDKLAKLEGMMNECDRSRKEQMKRKQVAQEQEKRDDLEMSKFWGDWCAYLDQQDKDEKGMRRGAAVALQSEHLKQIEHRRLVAKGEKDMELLVVGRAKQAIEVDDLEYYQYAEEVIREYAEEGKNVIPLIKELREYRKRKNE